MKFSLPMKAPSASNQREHWSARHRRTSPQRAAAMLVMQGKRHQLGGWRLVVRLTRVAPRALDDDNLRGALKAYRDGLAAGLRVDDATPLVRWEYEQRKSATPHECCIDVSLYWEVVTP